MIAELLQCFAVREAIPHPPLSTTSSVWKKENEKGENAYMYVRNIAYMSVRKYKPVRSLSTRRELKGMWMFDHVTLYGCIFMYLDIPFLSVLFFGPFNDYYSQMISHMCMF